MGEAPLAPTGVGVIEVRVRDLDRLFNTIDPSPFRDRDLDRDADWWPLRDERRILDRLSKMDVRVLQNEGHGTRGEGSAHAGAGRYA